VSQRYGDVAECFLRVTNFVDPPSRLQDPALIPRIVMGNIRALFARKRNRAASAVAGAQRPRPAAVTVEAT